MADAAAAQRLKQQAIITKGNFTGTTEAFAHYDLWTKTDFNEQNYADIFHIPFNAEPGSDGPSYKSITKAIWAELRGESEVSKKGEGQIGVGWSSGSYSASVTTTSYSVASSGDSRRSSRTNSPSTRQSSLMDKETRRQRRDCLAQ